MAEIDQVKSELERIMGSKGGAAAAAMADNGAGHPLDPWPGRFEERGADMQCGPCVDDVSWRKSDTVLSVQRYATAFVTVLRTASGGLAIKQNSDAPLVMFSAGVKESGSDVGLPEGVKLTLADTNGAEEGALSGNEKIDFRIAGMGVHIEEPFRLATVEGDAFGQLVEDFWETYSERLVRRFARAAFITFRHGKTDADKFQLGKLQFHPPMAGLTGRSGVNVGLPVASGFVPLNAPDFGGGPKDDAGLTLELNIARTIGLPADPGAPVPTLGGGELFLLPVCFELYGRNVRNGKIVTRGDVQQVAAQTTLDIVGALIENTDLSDPAQVAMLAKNLRTIKGAK